MRKLAVITGASAGIGTEFARQLAGQGYALLLVARREERLRQLADELGGEPHAVYSCDLADHAQTQQLAEHLRTLPTISLLVNNAGFGIGDSIAEGAVEQQLAMMHVHMTASYLLCQAVLPQMIAQQSGAIINVSSIAAYFHGAKAANYCATKAYLNSFSQSLQQEVAQHGITVQALCPGYTVTEFHAAMGEFDRGSVPDRLWDSAEFVVTTSLNSLSGNKVIIIPGRKNKLLVLTGANPIINTARKIIGRLLRR